MSDTTPPTKHAVRKQAAATKTNGDTTAKRQEARTKFEVSLELIDPDRASEMLGTNTHNRNIRPSFVEKLAGAITRDEWEVNGEGIRFDKSGRLLDGQHRLWAIVMADKPVETLVVRGLESEAQDTIDTGLRRKLSDVLSLRGESDTLTLSAGLSLYWRVKNGMARSGRGMAPTPTQAIALLEDEPGMRHAVKVALRVRRAGVWLPPSALACAYHQFAQMPDQRHGDQAEADVDVFFDRLADGVELKAKSPIYALRRQVEAARTSARRADPVYYHALLIKAWNAFREGRQVEMLSFKMGGARPEPWPEPV